jgi:hypothetical protein
MRSEAEHHNIVECCRGWILNTWRRFRWGQGSSSGVLTQKNRSSTNPVKGNDTDAMGMDRRDGLISLISALVGRRSNKIMLSDIRCIVGVAKKTTSMEVNVFIIVTRDNSVMKISSVYSLLSLGTVWMASRVGNA